MKLYVEEILTEVSQVLIPNDKKKIYAIRPHLYVKNRPTGTLKVQITTTDDILIAESIELTISSITASNEYHGYVRFYIGAFLRKDQSYKFKVVAGGGYSFSESGFCAVCKDAGFKKYSYTNPISSYRLAPLDFEIWTESTK